MQKLMYFLQVAGVPLRLRFERGVYGPYADNLRHSLRAVEGHFLNGFGDASKPVTSAEPISVLPGAAGEAEAKLADHPDTLARIERVLSLSDGFETAYGMELLSTVHWVTRTADGDGVSSASGAADRVRGWSSRKKRMFGRDHIAVAWERLAGQGWLAASTTPS